MKKILFLALAMLTLGSQMYVSAAKKDKKEIKWEWDGTTSGNETIDKYLMKIDTLYYKVRDYKDNLEQYQLKDTVVCINGKYYELNWMEDSQGQLLTRGSVNWQCVQAVTMGANIVLDMTNAGLGSATAALALPQLGLKALKFAKYVKGGPAVIQSGIESIKAVRGKWVGNSRKWKAVKDGAISDPTKIGFSPAVAEKLNKCYYVKEITTESPDYEEVVKKFTGKTPEELAQEANGVANDIAKATVLPEDKSKSLDQMPSDDDLEKELG